LHLVGLLYIIIPRNFCENRLTFAGVLDVAKAFDILWIEDLIYMLTLLKFPPHIIHIFSSYLRVRTFEASFQTATSFCRDMRAGVAQGGLISL